jgi:hypothetical protein
VSLLGVGHFLERQDVLLLLIDSGRQELLRLPGGFAQRFVQPALDGGRAFTRAEPGVQTGVGKRDGDDGGHHIDANEHRPAAHMASGGAETDQPGHQHQRGLHSDGRQCREPHGKIQRHALEGGVPGNDGQQATGDEQSLDHGPR